MSDNEQQWIPQVGDTVYSERFEGAGEVVAVEGDSVDVGIYWDGSPIYDEVTMSLNQLRQSPPLPPIAVRLQRQLDLALAALNKIIAGSPTPATDAYFALKEIQEAATDDREHDAR